MTVGAATEQATSFIQTGKAADLDRTAVAAAGFRPDEYGLSRSWPSHQQRR
jgi:hypothetical protein